LGPQRNDSWQGGLAGTISKPVQLIAYRAHDKGPTSTKQIKEIPPLWARPIALAKPSPKEELRQRKRPEARAPNDIGPARHGVKEAADRDGCEKGLRTQCQGEANGMPNGIELKSLFEIGCRRAGRFEC
jgi:hypothetical protein